MRFRTLKNQFVDIWVERLGPEGRIHPDVFAEIGELSGVDLWDALCQLEAWAASDKRPVAYGGAAYDAHAFAVLRAVADEANARWETAVGPVEDLELA